jgi:carbonic anhydrase
MEKLVEGVKKFQAEVFSAKRALFSRLSESQTPRALFVTCSDSRIDPTLLTQAEPGELFILRNAGNIIPSYGETMGGSTATIEYAVGMLGVKHVIVCGHTDCGVMRALLHPESVEDLPAVKSWMRQAETTRRIVRDITPASEATSCWSRPSRRIYGFSSTTSKPIRRWLCV